MISGTVDLREYNRAITKLSQAWKRRTIPQILNRSAGSIAIKAMANTRASSRKQIRDYFKTQVASRVKIYRSKKRLGEVKRFKNEAVFDYNETAILVFLKRFPAFRKYREFADVFWAELAKFVGRAISSAHYLQHGWKEVIDIFRKHIKEYWVNKSLPAGYSHKSGKRPLGTGKPAREGADKWQAVAEIYNRAVIEHESARPMAQEALNKAVRDETAQLLATAEKALAKDVKAVGG